MFNVLSEPCDQCLMSENLIVSKERRKQLLQQIARDGSFFVCHKSTLQNRECCCRAWYDTLGHTSNIVRIAQRFGLVRFVEEKDISRVCKRVSEEETSDED